MVVPDHPRACGANETLFPRNYSPYGSSPRVRGKPKRLAHKSDVSRIIPARAGQTIRQTGRLADCADHPRACGANSDNSSTTTSRSGSSPRVRGKLLLFGCRVGSMRIIPARAGQTWLPRAIFTSFPDHPRACGANLEANFGGINKAGSSPRVRGKRLRHEKLLHEGRIIPARAGQTDRQDHSALHRTDHPRACGANLSNAVQKANPYGSSPRVRGKQSDFMRKLLSAGPSIIGFAQWLQSSCYCSCFQSSAKTPISRGTTPTSLFLGFQNSITLLLLT